MNCHHCSRRATLRALRTDTDNYGRQYAWRSYCQEHLVIQVSKYPLKIKPVWRKD